MISKKLVTLTLVSAAAIVGAYAYRAASPIVVPPPAEPTALLLPAQQILPGAQVLATKPCFVHTILIHGFQLNVFRRTSAYMLQLAPHISVDYADYLVDPILIGAATLEYNVLGIPYLLQFGSSGNVWVAALPKSVAAAGVLGNATLRIWRKGTDYTNPQAAAFVRQFAIIPQ
jgi:hypothetical protein